MRLEIIDNAIPHHLLRSLSATWPEASWRGWHQYKDGNSIKRTTRDAEQIPRAAWPCLNAMARIVEHECGFPDWDLQGAGLHEIPSGGHLRRHLDSDVMLSTGWRRELSVVLFCNERWQEDWGGKLIVQQTEIVPRFGRMVVFETNDESWHEVTQVTGPLARRTLSVFYWSQEPTEGKRPTAMFS